jgi:Cd2+/Zn2+-exporting ATPase
MRALKDIQSLLTLLCGVFLVAGMFAPHSLLPYASVAFGSYFALKAAWSSLRERSVDVNFLMVLAAAGALGVGHPLEAAVLLFLFSLSSTLEALAMAKTQSAIEGLIKLRPDRALRVRPEGDELVPVEELCIDDVVRVPPFEQIPTDGEVTSGSSAANQAAMTGESEPVPKVPGDSVFAGTQNLDGMLLIRVTARTGETALEKIVELVRQAQLHKASGERISAWFGQKYTLFVIGAFAVSLVVRLMMGQPREDALYMALTLLVALSPCALVISTPASTLSALAWSARNGILIRGGKYIEIAGKIDTLALDKTGTLTEGKFRLAEICVCRREHMAVPGGEALCRDEEQCWRGESEMSSESRQALRMAAAAEQYSSHPIAEAVVGAARDWRLDVPEASESVAHAGLGVTARVGDTLVSVGQKRFFEQGGRSLPPEFAKHVTALQRRGMTAVVVNFEDRYSALGLRDSPRPGASEVIDECRQLGVKEVLLLTGDTEETARAVADELGIETVYAGLLPQAKAEIVEAHQGRGRTVMMVGDGINDAPVLAVSALGVAMGGLGSDVALNSANVVLMNDRLQDLPRVIRLGKRTYRIIRANLIFSTAMIVGLAIVTTVFDSFAPGHANWVLPIAVIGHEGSTVLVILNGLRLMRGPESRRTS